MPSKESAQSAKEGDEKAFSKHIINRKFVKTLSRIFYKEGVDEAYFLGYNDKDYRLKIVELNHKERCGSHERPDTFGLADTAGNFSGGTPLRVRGCGAVAAK